MPEDDTSRSMVRTLLEEKGFSIVDEHNSGILTIPQGEDTSTAWARRGAIVIDDHFEELVEQLRENPSPLEEFHGFQTSNGYFEFYVENPSIQLYRRSTPIYSGRLGKLTAPTNSDTFNCQHIAGARSIDMSRYTQVPDRPSARLPEPIHLPGAPCVELSWGTACARLYSPGELRIRFEQDRSQLRPDLTIKIFGTEQLSEAEAMKIASSFLYELAARNGALLALAPRTENTQSPAKKHRTIVDEVRYPSTRINSEVSELFQFAEAVNLNRPLSFLSYYQVLEYYFPLATTQDTVRRLRKEIRDVRFNPDANEDLLRVVKIAGASARVTEEEQLKLLVHEVADETRIREFVMHEDVRAHFGKRGKITVRQPINTGQSISSAALLTQVAERIYFIRNRIVHSKDDPRFADAPILLPRSGEAEALGPDIEVVRMLAIDAISYFQ
ncbi:hypothetical protein LB823_09345 [Tsukamurella sp. M9C]|uniref:hypothetical protein n=1 Tax=Tsukamurella sp. M9C TaxID=2877520 RepID=UPI001CCE609F|nr:hypothetical protein [Tsukamurella sp. M9C]MCA0156404.1 hypothetical protein [Tsukamurella sp. M9C]